MIQYNKIVIEGNIGSGKSTLTKILAEKLDFEAVYEVFDKNQFLEKFYEKKLSENYALESSLLISRLNSLSKVNWNESKKIVADFWIKKSLIFAYINLNNKELTELFNANFELLKRNIEEPDLIIYLKSDPNRIIKRIKNRGRIMEQKIDLKYLEKIHKEYENIFNKTNSIPIIEIDTHKFEFSKNQNDLDLLLSYLIKKRGKSYTYLLK